MGRAAWERGVERKLFSRRPHFCEEKPLGIAAARSISGAACWDLRRPSPVGNGAAAQKVLRSYRRHPPVAATTLVLFIASGPGPPRRRALEASPRPLQLAPRGSTSALLPRAREFDYDCYCFLNSLADPGRDGWRRWRACARRRRRLVGASAPGEPPPTSRPCPRRAARAVLNLMRRRRVLVERHSSVPHLPRPTNAFMLRATCCSAQGGTRARSWTRTVRSGKPADGSGPARGERGPGRRPRRREGAGTYSCTLGAAPEQPARRRHRTQIRGRRLGRAHAPLPKPGRAGAPPRCCAGGPSASV